MSDDEQSAVEYPLRADPYYGGVLQFEVRPASHGGDPDLVLIWAPYEGGSVEIILTRPRIPPNVPGIAGKEGEFEVDFDEATLMRDALTKIIDSWPPYRR